MRACELFDRTGDPLLASTAAAMLAEIQFRQGHLDETEELTGIAEECRASGDLDLEIRWRFTRAKVLAARGEAVEAERIAREAVTIATGTYLLAQPSWERAGGAAEAQSAAGDAAAARETAAEAIGVYEAKGNLAAARRARKPFEEGASTDALPR